MRRDRLWRLAVVTSGPIAGFDHLEPLRLIPEITQLDGEEVVTLDRGLADGTRALERPPVPS